jgi:hypothetical protein
VVAAFDGGAITSDAGALLLGAADRAIKLMDRFAACFHDVRRQDLIEHEVVTLVGQRVYGIALGYEDLNDHDELRYDPVMAVLAGKLEARREDCAPVAGNVHLPEPTFHHGQPGHDPIDGFERRGDDLKLVGLEQFWMQTARHRVADQVDDNAGIVAGLMLACEIDRLVEQLVDRLNGPVVFAAAYPLALISKQ